MDPHHPIPLHRCTPSPHYQPQDELLSDGFPPIRERKNSEAPIRVPRRRRRRSPAVQKDQRQPRSPPSRLPQHPRLPDTGLGGTRSILNTIAVRHAQKSPLKRPLESPSNDNDHPLKRYCLTSVYEEDMDWIKNVLKDIQASLNKITDLKDDVDVKIEEVICRLH